MKTALTLLLVIGLFPVGGCSKSDGTVAGLDGTIIPNPNQYDVPFAGVPATSDLAIYEVNMRAFSADGTLKGVQARLDSIRALGINTIWLMPIFPVGQLRSVGQMGSPYSVRNYREVNPELGTLEDLGALVKAAHARDMAVVLDWVANHTSWDNPWITAHKEWYAQDASGNIIIPPGTNWQDVAQLNYANTQMRDSMIAAMKSWVLNANVDGFRCDAADRVPYAFWKQALDAIKAMPNRRVILLAEGSRSDQFTAGFQVNYSWDYYAMLKNVFRNGYTPANLVATHGNEYIVLPAGAAKLRFTTNHDETAWDDTPVGLFGGVRGSMSAFVAAAFLGGVPMIYNGQEVGLTVKLPFFSRSPINWNNDPVLFQEYKRLMAFRNGSDVVKTGTLTSHSTGDLLAFVRTSGPLQVLVVTNTRNATASFPLPAALAGMTWRDAFTGTTVGFAAPLSLDPYEYRIFRNY